MVEQPRQGQHEAAPKPGYADPNGLFCHHLPRELSPLAGPKTFWTKPDRADNYFGIEVHVKLGGLDTPGAGGTDGYDRDGGEI
jgi:hypothetical protein